MCFDLSFRDSQIGQMKTMTKKDMTNTEIKPINQKYNLCYQINSIKIGVEKVKERNWWL